MSFSSVTWPRHSLRIMPVIAWMVVVSRLTTKVLKVPSPRLARTNVLSSMSHTRSHSVQHAIVFVCISTASKQAISQSVAHVDSVRRDTYIVPGPLSGAQALQRLSSISTSISTSCLATLQRLLNQLRNHTISISLSLVRSFRFGIRINTLARARARERERIESRASHTHSPHNVVINCRRSCVL